MFSIPEAVWLGAPAWASFACGSAVASFFIDDGVVDGDGAWSFEACSLQTVWEVRAPGTGRCMEVEVTRIYPLFRIEYMLLQSAYLAKSRMTFWIFSTTLQTGQAIVLDLVRVPGSSRLLHGGQAPQPPWFSLRSRLSSRNAV